MADTHFLSSIPTLLLGGTVAASYTWLALRRVTEDPEVNAAIHLAAGIFWTTAAYTARAALLGAVLARVPAALGARLLGLARRRLQPGLRLRLLARAPGDLPAAAGRPARPGPAVARLDAGAGRAAAGAAAAGPARAGDEADDAVAPDVRPLSGSVLERRTT